jgi:hypothetical protein
MAPYMLQAQQKWTITPVANAGGYPGSPYFRITIGGTDRALAATADAELVVLPAFTGGPEQLWRIDQLTDATYRLMPKAVQRRRHRRSRPSAAMPTLASSGPTAIGSAGCSRRHDRVLQDASMKTRACAFLPALGALAVFCGSATSAGAGQQPASAPAPAPARGPAPSLTRPASATKATDAAGFLRRWLVLEPIRVAGQLTDSAVQAVVKKEYFPNQFTVVPQHGDPVTVGDDTLQWHAVDTIAYNLNLYHFVRREQADVQRPQARHHRQMRRGRCQVCDWRSARTASVWWLNGRK